MPFGPKYKIVYDDKGQVADKKIVAAVILPPNNMQIKITAKAAPNTVRINPPVLKPPQPSGESRGMVIAKKLVSSGIKDKPAIHQAIYDYYKANTNRTENKILKDCRLAIAQLEKEKLI